MPTPTSHPLHANRPTRSASRRGFAILVALAGLASPPAQAILVTTGGDPDPAGEGTCSLRQALIAVSSAVNTTDCIGATNVVEMAPWLVGHTIRLEHGQLEVLNTTQGRDIAVFGNGLTIDARQASRVLRVWEPTDPVETNRLRLYDVTLTGGSASGGAGDTSGGAIFSGGRVFLELWRSTVIGNSAADDGGGIAARALTGSAEGWPHVRIFDSQINGNVAQTGGGGVSVLNVNLALVRSTVSDNNAAGAMGRGGGVVALKLASGASTQVSVYRSTISGNTTPPRSDIGEGGAAAIQAEDMPVVMYGATVTDNEGGAAAAVWVIGASAAINDSIVSANRVGALDPASNPDFDVVAGSATATRSVIGIGAQSYFASGGNVFTDAPGLAPLADNGGSAPTHLPGASSPALELVGSAACSYNVAPPYPVVVSTDQRGVSIPQATFCDAGAVERRSGTFTIATTVTGSGRVDASPLPAGGGGIVACTSSGGSACSATFAAEDDPSTMTLGATPDAGWKFDAWSGDCVASWIDVTATLVIDANRSCSASFVPDTNAIGGIVQGLAGSGLVLRLNGADDLPIAADGRFAFTNELAAGANYAVTVATQPSSPPQTCNVQAGSGVANSDVDDVVVLCDAASVPVDVSVAIDDGETISSNGGAATYSIDVRNDGVETAYRIALATSITPAGALDGLTWTCSGTCYPGQGVGPADLTLDLPANARARIELTGTVSAVSGATLEVGAQLELLPHYGDVPDDNSAIDVNTYDDVFRDGFEATD